MEFQITLKEFRMITWMINSLRVKLSLFEGGLVNKISLLFRIVTLSWFTDNRTRRRLKEEMNFLSTAGER
ncbi:hypothetical protein NC653_008924 [Populus alba x Populus x berolinensis]|uniref:Uncharacterized protein n=1 Tax=Populus alba x Populus x berolinensis TaxID=444605 RepID=A0AAD6W930_9ROSI|nr:hypothetical protein NC653_008924 [Populus alba x Populus x berolinensis]